MAKPKPKPRPTRPDPKGIPPAAPIVRDDRPTIELLNQATGALPIAIRHVRPVTRRR